MIKVAVPNAVCRVIDRAMQSFGAAGEFFAFHGWLGALHIHCACAGFSDIITVSRK